MGVRQGERGRMVQGRACRWGDQAQQLMKHAGREKEWRRRAECVATWHSLLGRPWLLAELLRGRPWLLCRGWELRPRILLRRRLVRCWRQRLLLTRQRLHALLLLLLLLRVFVARLPAGARVMLSGRTC